MTFDPTFAKSQVKVETGSKKKKKKKSPGPTSQAMAGPLF